MSRLGVKPLNILDFDIENRPISYLGPDYSTAEVTVIAWKFLDPSEYADGVEVVSLGKRDKSPKRLLRRFLEAYNRADMVTGHYIRKHDLPVINGALLEVGLPPLEQKLASDTKLDLKDSKYMSLSQEALAGMLGLDNAKYHMTQPMWRAANRLTQQGIGLAEERCASDVIMHIEMRERLLELGWLGPPKVWRP